jgi:hypothetical protein
VSALLTDEPQPFVAPTGSSSPLHRTISTAAAVAFSVVLLGVQLAQLFLRDPAWTIDSRWALSQYLFSMVLFAPVVAAMGAHQGRAVVRAAWLVRARPWRGLASFAVPAVLVPLAVFAGGAAATLAVATLRGAPLALTAWDWLALLAALVGVVCHAVLGLAFGAWVRLRLVVPLTAAIVFGLTMLAWIAGGRVLVDFGGATGGVIGIHATPDAYGVRAAFLGALTVVGIAGARAAVGFRQRVRRLLAVALVSSALLGAAGTTLSDGYQQTAEQWTCQGSAPEVCVPVRLARLLPDLHAAITDQGLAAEVATASKNAAQRIEVDDSVLLALVADTGPDAATDGAVLERIGNLVYSEMVAPGCLPGHLDPAELPGNGPAAWQSLATWIWWRTSVPDPEMLPPTAADLGVPDVQIGTPEADAFLTEAIDGLPPCQ